MELGNRLKQARLDAGLSQRQLCGEKITRNMLSQIENGSAKPSMQTLGYLAERLGKPISYFLEEDAVCSPNQQVMEQARHAYAEANFRQVTQLLQGYRAPDGVFDPEKHLLEALSFMAQAEQATDQGKKVYAQELLEKAGQAGEKTPYYTPAAERERQLLLASAGQAASLPEDHREQYLRCRQALQQQQYARCAFLLDGMPCEEAQWFFLRAQVAQGMKEFSRAVSCYLSAEQAFPRECAQALEICYRELGDYKNAYLYACRQRELGV